MGGHGVPVRGLGESTGRYVLQCAKYQSDSPQSTFRSYLPPMRVHTLHIGTVPSSRGTIRGGSFLSAVLAAISLRRWFLTVDPLPSLHS
jgi:hypothetical protein